MRLVFSIREWFMIAFAVTFIWTKWYRIVGFSWIRYVTTGEFTVSVLWTLHLSVRFPLARKARREQLRGHLPRYL